MYIKPEKCFHSQSTSEKRNCNYYNIEVEFKLL